MQIHGELVLKRDVEVAWLGCAAPRLPGFRGEVQDILFTKLGTHRSLKYTENNMKRDHIVRCNFACADPWVYMDSPLPLRTLRST